MMSTNNRPKEENRKRLTAREHEEHRANEASDLVSPKTREDETKRTDRNRDPEIENAGDVEPMDPSV